MIMILDILELEHGADVCEKETTQIVEDNILIFFDAHLYFV